MEPLEICGYTYLKRGKKVMSTYITYDTYMVWDWSGENTWELNEKIVKWEWFLKRYLLVHVRIDIP